LQSLAHRAYGTVQQRTAGEREIELALLQQITDALEELSESDSVSTSTCTDIVSRNLQMWTLFASDVLLPDNGLPTDVKKSILYLSEFVRRTSMDLFSGGTEGIADLIDINKNIMQGLAGEGLSDNVVSGVF